MMKKLLFYLTLLVNLTVFAQTNISGGIYSNTTFTLNNSPYIVTDDVALFPDVELIIEPGVEIKFDAGKYFEVRGEIIAIGNSSNRIIFTSNVSPQSKGDWIGIQVKNSLGAKASFEYCDFKFATASNSSDCCWAGGPIYYKNCKFESNDSALIGYTGYDINIDSCEFINNTYCIRDADKNIINSTFTNNDYGLYATERVDVDNSTFTNNGTAIYGSRGLFQNSVITNNTVGIDGYVFGEFEIRNNVISNNDIGIKDSGYDPASSIIKNNEICNNIIFNVENLNNVNKDLTDNCWCTEDENLIEEKLKDGYDDITLGLYNYSIYDEMCDQIIIEVIKDPLLSIGSLTAILENVTIYPNPSIDYINVALNQNIERLNIELYSIQGQLIFNSTNENISELRISTSGIPSGVYIMQLSSPEGSVYRKLIKE